jgi:hypothetical protein
MKGLFLSIGVATAMALGGQASAGVGPPVGGEASSVFSCFYECKPGSRLGTWAEVTTLMLVNQRAPIDEPPLNGGFFADLAILDGNQGPCLSVFAGGPRCRAPGPRAGGRADRGRLIRKS